MVLTGQGEQGHRPADQPGTARSPSACPARTRNLFTASRKPAIVDGAPVDIGLVGEIRRVDAGAVRALLDDRRIPVISSVARGEDGEVYNVNADTAAAALAVALGAAKLDRPHRRAPACTGPGRHTGDVISEVGADELETHAARAEHRA